MYGIGMTSPSDSSARGADQAQSPTTRLLILSVVIMLAGVFVAAAPHVSRLDVRVIIAFLLLLTSCFHLAFAWPFRPQLAALWQVMLSAAYFAIGLYLLGHRELSVDSIRMPVAAYLLIDGLLEWGLLSRVARPAPRRWLALDAATTVVIAAMVATSWPSHESSFLAALIGLNTFLGGLTRLIATMSLRVTR
jgi:uncharacterized membrane protein HdeD (DUF308 family)